MPTATRFLYPKSVSPELHCIASKTTAELDAMECTRYEAATLADAMALWWNLHTVDYSVKFGSDSAQTGTSISMRLLSAGGGAFDVDAAPVATPNTRICSDFDAASVDDICTISPYASPLTDGGGSDTWLELWMKRVYYNTTTSKYAVQIGMRCTGGAAGTVFTGLGGDPSTTYSNGGSVTIFGDSTFAGFVGAGDPNVVVSLSSPSYYTY